MSNYDDNESLGFLQKLLIAAIFITVILIPSWACITRNLNREPAAIIIGRQSPMPEPTPTPNPVFIILVEQAKASARVQVITAETDNEIKLRWNIHFMRRFWAWYAIPVGFIVASLGLYYWGLRYGRQ